MVDAGAAQTAKQMQRAIWSTGQWDEIARTIEDVGAKVLDRVGIEPGMELLDVGTGSGGNVAIPAAKRGAVVIGCDLTPELFDHARRRASEAGVSVEWIEGDAEDLPFEDDRFDRVVSTFAHMFAPRHAVATAELARVCRPDGVIAFTTWTAESLPNRMFFAMRSFMPPQPEGIEGPITWGDEGHIREMLEPHDLQVTITRESAAHSFTTAEDAIGFFEEKFGGLVLARSLLEAQGRWDALLSALNEALEESRDGDGRVPMGDYLLTVARRPTS